MARLAPALPLLLFLVSCLPLSMAAMVSSPKKKADFVARREDIPYIKCQVCEKIAHQIHHQVDKKQAKVAPKKVSEFDIIEIAENVCNLKKTEAEWILQIDIVEKGNRLELAEQGVEGQCNSECKTIERACQEVMGYSDTDVAEFVFKKDPSIDLLVDFLCHDLSGACSVKPPPVPEDRTPGEPFVPKPSKDAEMEKILRSMEGMPGAPSMKMYSRDDLMNMNKFGDEEANEDEDEDEDDDADEEKFPTKLGKVLREKNSLPKDLKQRIVRGITQTGNAIKGHVNKVSQKVRKWWKGKKIGSSPSKVGKVEL